MRKSELRIWKLLLVIGAAIATMSPVPTLASVYLPIVIAGDHDRLVDDDVEYLARLDDGTVTVTKIVDNGNVDERQAGLEYLAGFYLQPTDIIAHVTAMLDVGDPDGSRNGVLLYVELDGGSGFAQYMSAQTVYYLAH